MATTRQILEQPHLPFIQRIMSSGTSINGNPMNGDKEEELSRSALALFKAKEDEIERRKMEVRDRVQTKIGLAEEATRRLAGKAGSKFDTKHFQNLEKIFSVLERVVVVKYSRAGSSNRSNAEGGIRDKEKIFNLTRLLTRRQYSKNGFTPELWG